MNKKRELLFSVTIKDCKVQTFRSGGPGGQNQNKVSSGVRIVHEASGAVGECRETKSQRQNKKRAFGRMAHTKTFTAWQCLEAARRMGVLRDIEARVERDMCPSNLKVEVRRNGKWNDEQGQTDGEGQARTVLRG